MMNGVVKDIAWTGIVSQLVNLFVRLVISLTRTTLVAHGQTELDEERNNLIYFNYELRNTKISQSFETLPHKHDHHHNKRSRRSVDGKEEPGEVTFDDKKNCKVQLPMHSLRYQFAEELTLCLFKDHWEEDVVEGLVVQIQEGNENLNDYSFMKKVNPVTGYAISQPGSLVYGYIINSNFYGQVRLFDKSLNHFIMYYIEPLNNLPLYNGSITMEEIEAKVATEMPDANAVIFEYLIMPHKNKRPLDKKPKHVEPEDHDRKPRRNEVIQSTTLPDRKRTTKNPKTAYPPTATTKTPAMVHSTTQESKAPKITTQASVVHSSTLTANGAGKATIQMIIHSSTTETPIKRSRSSLPVLASSQAPINKLAPKKGLVHSSTLPPHQSTVKETSSIVHSTTMTSKSRTKAADQGIIDSSTKPTVPKKVAHLESIIHSTTMTPTTSKAIAYVYSTSAPQKGKRPPFAVSSIAPERKKSLNKLIIHSTTTIPGPDKEPATLQQIIHSSTVTATGVNPTAFSGIVHSSTLTPQKELAKVESPLIIHSTAQTPKAAVASAQKLIIHSTTVANKESHQDTVQKIVHSTTAKASVKMTKAPKAVLASSQAPINKFAPKTGLVHSSTLPPQQSKVKATSSIVHSTTMASKSRNEAASQGIIHSSTQPTVPKKVAHLESIIHSTTMTPSLTATSKAIAYVYSTSAPEKGKRPFYVASSEAPGRKKPLNKLIVYSTTTIPRPDKEPASPQQIIHSSTVAPTAVKPTTFSRIVHSSTLPQKQLPKVESLLIIHSTTQKTKAAVASGLKLIIHSTTVPTKEPHQDTVQKIVHSTTAKASVKMTKAPKAVLASSQAPINKLAPKKELVYSSTLPPHQATVKATSSVVNSTTKVSKSRTKAANQGIIHSSTQSTVLKKVAHLESIIHSTTMTPTTSKDIAYVYSTSAPQKGKRPPFAASSEAPERKKPLKQLIIRSTTTIPGPNKEAATPHQIIHSSTVIPTAVKPTAFPRIVHSSTLPQKQLTKVESPLIIHSTTQKPKAAVASAQKLIIHSTTVPTKEPLQATVQKIVYSTSAQASLKMTGAPTAILASSQAPINKLAIKKGLVHSSTLPPHQSTVKATSSIVNSTTEASKPRNKAGSQGIIHSSTHPSVPKKVARLESIIHSTTMTPALTATSKAISYVYSTSAPEKGKRPPFAVSSIAPERKKSLNKLIIHSTTTIPRPIKEAATPHQIIHSSTVAPTAVKPTTFSRIVHSSTLPQKQLPKVESPLIIDSTTQKPKAAVASTLKLIIHSTTVATKEPLQATVHKIVHSTTAKASLKMTVAPVPVLASSQAPINKLAPKKELVHSSMLPPHQSTVKATSSVMNSTTKASKLRNKVGSQGIIHSSTHPSVPKKVAHLESIIHSTTMTPTTSKAIAYLYSTSAPEKGKRPPFAVSSEAPERKTPFKKIIIRSTTTIPGPDKEPATLQQIIHSSTVIPTAVKPTAFSRIVHSSTLPQKELAKVESPLILHSTTQKPKAAVASTQKLLIQSTTVPTKEPLQATVQKIVYSTTAQASLKMTSASIAVLASTQAPNKQAITKKIMVHSSTLPAQASPTKVGSSIVHSTTVAKPASLTKAETVASAPAPAAGEAPAPLPIVGDGSDEFEEKRFQLSTVKSTKPTPPPPPPPTTLHYLSTAATKKIARKRRYADIDEFDPAVSTLRPSGQLSKPHSTQLGKRHWRFKRDAPPPQQGKLSEASQSVALDDEDDMVEEVLFPKGHKTGTVDAFDIERSSSLLCKLCMWIQPIFAHKFGFQLGQDYGVAEMVDLVRYMNWVLRPMDFNNDFRPENIGFAIRHVIVSTIPEIDNIPEEEWENNARKLVPMISKLLTAKFSEGDQKPCCAILAFVDVNMPPFGTLAYRRSMCVKDKNFAMISGGIQGYKVAKYDIYRLTMHALGHLMGALNDDVGDPDCYDENPSGYNNPFIMNPNHQLNVGVRPNSMRMSFCARIKVAVYLGSSHSSCFESSPRPYCGNGIVEPGEECDCGSPWQCLFVEECCGLKDSFLPCKMIKKIPTTKYRFPQVMERDADELGE